MHSPERICEALEWLYGGTYDVDDNVPYLKDTAYLLNPRGTAANGRLHYVRVGKRGDVKAVWPYSRHEDITANVAHALEVTAPWEWTRSSTGHWHGYGGKREDVVSAGLYEKTTPVPWWWNIGTMKHEDSAPNVDAAKTAARAAYLTWMRGLFAMKGLPNG